MKKAVWISFFTALVVVNLAAWAMESFAGVMVPMPYRLTLVLSITLISMVFAGAWMLVGRAEEERSSDKSQQGPRNRQ